MTLAYTPPVASNRATVAVAIVCSIVMVIDTSIVSIVVSANRNPNPATSSVLFFILVAIFLFSNYWFFRYANTFNTPKITGLNIFSLTQMDSEGSSDSLSPYF